MGSKHKRRESTSARLAMFKLEEAVGERELGELRKVYDEKVDRLVSMLVLPSEALPNSKSRRSFSRQLTAAKVLEHPGIVPVLDGGTNDGEGHGFVVTDYVEGQTLRKRLNQGPIPAEEAVGLAVDALNALAYAHHRKHLHCGLSPDNVLIVEGEGRPRARLAHFGFHAVVGEERESAYGGLRVDPAYAAPEVLKNEPADPRADVYSVGALLFEMLTGRHPISAGDDPIERRLSERADALPQDAVSDDDLGQRLRAALKQALEQDPSERFGSARAFALALSDQDAADPDPWAWGEACAAGGTCASSGDKILPFSQRSWSRKQSDRPFRCRVTDKDYAGAAQWDARGLCSRGARHKPIPAVEGEPPADVEFELSAPAPAEASEVEAAQQDEKADEPAKQDETAKEEASKDEGQDRREALRALISSEVGWIGEGEETKPAPRTKESASEAKESSSEPEESSSEAKDEAKDEAKEADAPKEKGKKGGLSESTVSDVGEAMFDAWKSTQKREAKAATERMKRITRKGVARPEPQADEESPAAEPKPPAPKAEPESKKSDESPIQPVSTTRRTARSSSEAAPAAGAADTTPFKLAIAALVIVLVFVLIDAGKKSKALEGRLETAKTEREKAESQLQTELETAYAARDGLNKSLGQERQRVGALSKETVSLGKELGARTKERDGLRQTLQEREGELAAQRKTLLATRSELTAREGERDAARTSVAALTTSLEVARGELARVREALQASQTLAKTLTTQRDEVRQQVADKTQELQEREREVASLRTDLTRERAEVAELTQRLRDSQAQLSASADQLRQSQADLAQAREQVAKVAQRERKALTELARANETLSKLRLAVTKAEVELAERAAERDQLDEEGLLLERWLENAEAEIARWKRAFREGARRSLALRGLNASGQAGGPPALRPGERSAQLAVPLDQVRAWAEQAQRGEGLLSLHLRCKGAPGALRAQALSEAQLTQPPVGGVELTLVPLGGGSYRAFLEPEALGTLLRTAPEGEASLGFTLTGGAAAATVEGAELVLNPLTPDLRARLQAGSPQPLR